MSVLRGILGATLGAATAGVLLRVRTVSKDRGMPLADVVADLPGILVEDVTRVADSARSAIQDGRVAAQAARRDFDEQVVVASRRREGNDV
ncbi:MAG: hypothetical protein JWM98_281 [Thermoleophilia bacterium]|nr:hypothetical protein [Thermoleophilia bacterium]